MTTLRLGQKVTIQQGELEVTGELTYARVYLKGGDPNGYVLGLEPKKQTPEELTNEKPALKPPMVTHHTSVYEEWAAGITGKYKAWEAQEKRKLKVGDWVLVKDEELTREDRKASDQAYRGVKAQVIYVHGDGDVNLQHPYMDYPTTVSQKHLEK